MNDRQTQAGYSWAYGAVSALEVIREQEVEKLNGLENPNNLSRRLARGRIIGVETPADIARLSRLNSPSRKPRGRRKKKR